MKEIKTVKELVVNTIIIEKSKFITYLKSIKNAEEANEYLNEIRSKHFDATHVCYAYVLNINGVENFKQSDDGEPSSTAGAPILNVLRLNEVSNIICIVVRYFGGIKLGAGGLVRAYGGSCSQALKLANLSVMRECDNYSLSFAYNLVKLMDIFLNNVNAIINNKDYDLQVIYNVTFKNEDDIKLLNEKFASMIEVKFIKKELIVI